MKTVLKLLLIAALLLSVLPVVTSAAVVYIDDTFNDLSQVEQGKTTAEINTVDGWVTLMKKNMANSLLLYQDSYDITVIDGSAINTYQFNGSISCKNSSLSISLGLTDPISIATQKYGECFVLDAGSKKATYYQFDGVSMVANPFITVSGFINPISIGTSKDSSDFGVLDNENINRYSFDGTGMVLNNALSINTGAETNPVSLAMRTDGFDYAVVDRANRQVKYYSFNGSAMVLNPLLSITASGELSNPKSISFDQKTGGYVLVDDNTVKVYQFDGTGMAYNSVLSRTGLHKPLAVASKPGSYDYAVLQEDAAGQPIVCYYAFSGAGMEEISSLRITGLTAIPYGNDQTLQGKGVVGEKMTSGLKLVADVELPAGTSISWQVTVDGITWADITNNGPPQMFVVSGNKPSYKAVLSTMNKTVTPKILRVRLIDASLALSNFQITSMVGPVIPGNPVLPARNPVKIWAGHNVTFRIDTLGRAQNVSAEVLVLSQTIQLNSSCGTIRNLNPLSAGDNTWEGTFYTDAAVPKDTWLDINFMASDGTDCIFVSYPDFAQIYGSALEGHPIHLTH